MARTATNQEGAAALHVRPATVRKYARENLLPYDTTPGGHRRFDRDEAVAAIHGQPAERTDAHDERGGILEPVPYVPIAPTSEVTIVAVVTDVGASDVGVYDSARDVGDWSSENTA